MDTDPTISRGSRRPALVVWVCESLPPYRARVHSRINEEVPGLRLIAVCTHGRERSFWPPVDAARVPHVVFGPEESAAQVGDRRYFGHEWGKARDILDWLTRARPDAVVVHGYNDPARLRLIAWCRWRSIPAFISADSNAAGDRPRGVKALAKRALIGTLARCVFGVMPFGSQGIAYFRKYGFRPGRMFPVPFEPDYELAGAVTADELAAASARHGLRPGRHRLLYCGRLAGEKRVDLAIRAFADLAAARPDWDLVILGDGPQEARLRESVPRHLDGRVHWLGRIKEMRQVFAVFHLSQVLLLPSDNEPWALVVNEALACGLAVICSDAVGAAAELVRDGVNGHRFPRGDLAACTDRLLRATEPEELARLRRGSAEVLDDWRRDGDPVRGFRRAMEACGVLKA